MDIGNPFAAVVARMGDRFSRNSQQPQFGLAEVLTAEPLRLRFAGQDFSRDEIKVNYTLQTHVVGAEATNLWGILYGPTDVCGAGWQHALHRINSDTMNISSLDTDSVEIKPVSIKPGDLLFVFYSQVDQMLVALCKVV